VRCFNGNVHFLRVPPKSGQLDDKAGLTAAVAELQRTFLHQLQPGSARGAGAGVGTTDRTSNTEALHQELTQAFAAPHLKRWTHLLVLDDVWDGAFIEQLRCDNMCGAILVTGRESVWQPLIAAAGSSTMQLQADAGSRETARTLMMDVLHEVHADISHNLQVGGEGAVSMHTVLNFFVVCGHNSYDGPC